MNPTGWTSNVDFAARLRRKRRLVGLTQAELAKAVGTHQPTVSAWESAAELPSRDLLLRLAEVLGERVDWLVNGTEQRGELEDLVLRVLDRIDRSDLELLAELDPAVLGAVLAALRAQQPRRGSRSRRTR